MSAEMTMQLRINGTEYTVEVEPRRLLADVLREECGLTGTKLGCEHGVCGSCTVLLDGEAVRSCLLLAVQCHRRELTTVEGLATRGRAARAAGGLLGRARAAVRLLHRRVPRPCRGRPPHRARRARRPRTAHPAAHLEPVPLHRIRRHRTRDPPRHRPSPRTHPTDPVRPRRAVAPAWVALTAHSEFAVVNRYQVGPDRDSVSPPTPTRRPAVSVTDRLHLRRHEVRQEKRCPTRNEGWDRFRKRGS